MLPTEVLAAGLHWLRHVLHFLVLRNDRHQCLRWGPDDWIRSGHRRNDHRDVGRGRPDHR